MEVLANETLEFTLHPAGGEGWLRCLWVEEECRELSSKYKAIFFKQRAPEGNETGHGSRQGGSRLGRVNGEESGWEAATQGAHHTGLKGLSRFSSQPIVFYFVLLPLIRHEVLPAEPIYYSLF